MCMERHEEIRAAELELLASSTRGDAARLGQFLHPEFVEIGRSGRRWTRDEIIASLGTEESLPAPETDEWEFMEPAPHLVLVTYRIRSGTSDSGVSSSRHVSVWDAASGKPRLRFHQGTPVLGAVDAATVHKETLHKETTE